MWLKEHSTLTLQKLPVLKRKDLQPSRPAPSSVIAEAAANESCVQELPKGSAF